MSYAISERPVLSMVTTMLDRAFEKISNGTGLILHSDQGAIPTQAVTVDALLGGHSAEHEPQRELSGQRCDRKFLWSAQE